MTVLDLTTAFTGDELLAACASLGVRRPLGLAESMARHPSAGARRTVPSLGPVAVSDNTAAALAALAAPEAIAVVERVANGRKRVTYVAVRGPWAAVHRIHGDHHIVESLDAENATEELLDAAGLDPMPSGGASKEVVDVSRGAFDRMAELAAINDVARAAAALEAEGAARDCAQAIANATCSNSVHVLGLRSLGVRYEGCELSWVGHDDPWLVPLPKRSADTGVVIRELMGPRHLRVQIESVEPRWLAAELSMLFD